MADLIGKSFGGYQIVEQIGRGGMANVYKAYQPSLDRDVAIKVLPPYYAEQDESFLQRFKREARAIAKLRHPNILMVMDFGEEGDLAYLVMEYVEAGTLKDRFTEPLSLKEVGKLFSQIASALDYAHGEGVVHRDVKPSNILLPKPDWALLTDFGLAKMVGGSLLTQSGLTVGTPAYMSPEQGSGARVDHRTDIYSLGVMLYEMVVGEVPYTAETPMAVVVKHIVEPLPMPRAKNPDIPEDLQRIILKALAKDPADRFDRAGEIVDALENIVNVQPDWSAAEIKAVTATRGEHIDEPATKMISEDKPTAFPVSKPTPTPVPATPPPTQTASAPAPKPKKKRSVWPFIIGGIALLAVCTVASIFAWNAFGSDILTMLNIEQPSPSNEILTADNGGGEEMEAGADKPDIPDFGKDDPWQIGLEALEAGDYSLAQGAFQAALDKEPFRWGDFIELINTLYYENGPVVAADLLEAGLRVMENPDRWDRSWLGWLRLEAGQAGKAYEVFRQLIKDHPNFWDGFSGFISAAYELGDERGAIEYLEEMGTRYPDQIYFPQAIAEIYTLLGDYGKAIEVYEELLRMSPEDPWLYLSAAEAFYYNGQRDRAFELIDKVVEYAGEDGYVLESAASFLMDAGDYKRAEKLYRDSLRLDPDNGYAYVGLANVLILLEKNWDEISGLLEEAERIADDWEDAWLFSDIGWAYLNFGDCDNAIRVFERALDIMPDLYDASDGIKDCGG